MTTTIDLSQIPAPDVVESLDYETIFAAMLADLRSRAPIFNALVESDPAYKILEVCAYRELLIRQRVNDAARSVMLAYATGSDLEHLAALYGVQRLLVDPGDPDAIPPVDPTYESDDRLRERVRMSPYGWSCAGSRESYRYHALSADADVADVSVISTTPGEVIVTVLATEGDGVPEQELLDVVETVLTGEQVRPLCDTVVVNPAELVHFTIDAQLVLSRGPDEAIALADVEQAVSAYLASRRRLGYDIAISGLYAALHQSGVQSATLLEPSEDVACNAQQAAFCDNVNIAVEGRDD